MGERYGRIPDALSACDLIAVSDLDGSKAHTIAARLGCMNCSSDALIAHPDVDAVCVCTPEDTHADIACAVLSRSPAHCEHGGGVRKDRGSRAPTPV